MKICERICLRDWSITDEAGNTLSLERGKQYTTAQRRGDDGSVVVFSRYWARTPADIWEPDGSSP